MAKSKWKKILNTRSNYTNLIKFFKKKKISVFFFNRGSNILKSFINNNIYIYKGNIFKKSFVNKYFSFIKVGELSFTRKPFTYPFKFKKKR